MALLGDEQRGDCSSRLEEAVSAGCLEGAVRHRRSGRAREMACSAVVAGQAGCTGAVMLRRMFHLMSLLRDAVHVGLGGHACRPREIAPMLTERHGERDKAM